MGIALALYKYNPTLPPLQTSLYFAMELHIRISYMLCMLWWSWNCNGLCDASHFLVNCHFCIRNAHGMYMACLKRLKFTQLSFGFDLLGNAMDWDLVSFHFTATQRLHQFIRGRMLNLYYTSGAIQLLRSYNTNTIPTITIKSCHLNFAPSKLAIYDQIILLTSHQHTMAHSQTLTVGK